MDSLLKLVKQSLSIVETATLKDEEIKMLIKAGIEDLNRAGANNVTEDTELALVKSAIVMYVKSHFGNVDIKEKELAQNAYNELCKAITLSENYKED